MDLQISISLSIYGMFDEKKINSVESLAYN